MSSEEEARAVSISALGCELKLAHCNISKFCPELKPSDSKELSSELFNQKKTAFLREIEAVHKDSPKLLDLLQSVAYSEAEITDIEEGIAFLDFQEKQFMSF